MKTRLLIITLLIFFSLDAIAQQAWVKKQGEYYTQIGASYIGHNSLFNGGNDFLPVWRQVSDFTLQAYAEVGLGKGAMLSGSLPMKYVRTSDKLNEESYLINQLPSGNLWSMGNINFALTYGITQKGSFVSAVKLRLGLKTSQYEPETGLRTGADAYGVAPSILAGYGWGKWFTSGEVGYNYRTNDYSSQVFVSAQLGRNLSDRWLAIFAYEYTQSLKDGLADNGTSVHTGLYLNDYTFYAPSLKFGYYIGDHWILWLSSGGLGLGFGNQLGAGPSFSFAVSYRGGGE